MKRNMRKIVFILVVLHSVFLLDKKRQKLYNGNQSFKEKKYADAEADFRVTESKKSPKKATAGYNLGIAYIVKTNKVKRKSNIFKP